MLRHLLTLAARLFPRIAGQVLSSNYVGRHGCLNTAMSFVTWNQVEGDYLEFGVWEGSSFAAAYHALQDNRRRHLAHGYDTPEYRRWKDNPPRLFAFDSFEGIPGGIR